VLTVVGRIAQWEASDPHAEGRWFEPVAPVARWQCRRAYGDAQLDALRLSLGALALAALLSLWFARRLPTELLAEDDV
jgi:hypothetical protein